MDNEQRLRAALVGVVGCDGEDKLRAMEAGVRMCRGVDEDEAAMLDAKIEAIHALIATLPCIEYQRYELPVGYESLEEKRKKSPITIKDLYDPLSRSLIADAMGEATATDVTKEGIYDAEIAPLMAKIIDICMRNKIAMLANFMIPSAEDAYLQAMTNLPDETGKIPERHQLAQKCINPNIGGKG